jgi:hypothetical protein
MWLLGLGLFNLQNYEPNTLLLFVIFQVCGIML